MKKKKKKKKQEEREAYLEGTEDARFTQAGMSRQIAETAPENIQMPQNLHQFNQKITFQISVQGSLAWIVIGRCDNAAPAPAPDAAVPAAAG